MSILRMTRRLRWIPSSGRRWSFRSNSQRLPGCLPTKCSRERLTSVTIYKRWCAPGLTSEPPSSRAGWMPVKSSRLIRCCWYFGEIVRTRSQRRCDPCPVESGRGWPGHLWHERKTARQKNRVPWGTFLNRNQLEFNTSFWYDLSLDFSHLLKHLKFKLS